jgi:flagellar basal body-associated protein FliL
MKRSKSPPLTGAVRIVYRSLLVLAAALLLFILGATVYAFFKPPDAIAAEAITSPGADIFTGIGRLRIAARDGEPATALLSITFPYPSADRAFTEELVSHVPDFRRSITAYFSAFSAPELVNMDESAAKAELLRRFNAELRLGSIAVLYFNDFMVLE